MAYFAESQKGQIRPVLFEHAEKNGMMQGYSDNYISVSVPYQATYVNHIIPYKI
jgi:threonylcarbamoyladenosine tRNA methylthiotransferase MtaB